MLVKCSALFSYHAPPSPAPLMSGWPKYAASALLTRTSDGAILVALPVPIVATLEDGTVVNVQTEYPFQDIIRVSVAVPIARTASLPLLLRIPGCGRSMPPSQSTAARRHASPMERRTIR